VDNFSNILLSLNPLRNNYYDRNKVKIFAEKYALSKNPNFPYFKENDCTNFISQAIYAGGVSQKYGLWSAATSWFCSSTNPSNLTKISLSWRSARYFRIHWANPYTKKYRATYYEEIPAEEAIVNFTENIYDKLSIGDVIQYINLKKDPHPYHTQVIHNKSVTDEFPYTNLFIAQHSADRVNVSLHKYIRNIQDRASTVICIYKIEI